MTAPTISKSQLGVNYIVSTLSIMIVLIIFGFFTLTLLNLKNYGIKLKENINVAIVFKPEAKVSEIELFYKKIISMPFCKNAEIYTPQKAVEIVSKSLNGDVLAILDTNPFPYLIKLNPTAQYSNVDSLAKISKILKKAKIIDEVYFNNEQVGGLQLLIKNLTIIFLALEFILLIMSVALISNLVQMYIQSKEKQIALMQLFGATDFFIMRPFLQSAFIQGLLSSLLAILVIVLSLYYYFMKVENPFKIDYIIPTFSLILIIGISITMLTTIFKTKTLLTKIQI